MNNRGFTLLETVVYIALVAIMLSGIAAFSKIVIQMRIRNQVITEIEQQAVHVAQILTKTINSADSITAPSPGVSASSLTLQMPTKGQNSTVFSLDAGALTIQEKSNNIVTLTNDHVVIDSLLFQNVSRVDTPGIVHFSFIMRFANDSGRAEYSYSKTFYGSANVY